MWVIRGLKKGVLTTEFPKKLSEEEEKMRSEVLVRRKPPFKKSLHVFFVDAGSCNACNREVEMLGNPYYDFHRLGIFFTPTPRHADVLMIVGCSEGMVEAVKRAYTAMPYPKVVVAAGECAEKFCEIAGIEADVVIKGCPPSPIALIEGLLGRESR